ncbi:unnamed protein product [Bemisia tabaci]|uniref:G-protein coupled receptors family 1 profile domain-containing protein n=1 Tax=Bemisia tabaci TaxID=7038 RepID=A0A9P0F453_BEMTA|nr:unnamed protein product [Bemisia tabaci]
MSYRSQPHYQAYNQPWNSRGGYGNESIIDRAPPEILHMMDAHWYQYPPMDPLWHTILGIFIAFLAVVSFFGNGMVVYIFSCTKTLRSPSNLLVVNLAFSDFCMMFTMAPTMAYNSYYGTWVLGAFACELYGMFGSLFGCVSIWSMVLIALDRYNVIVKGLSAKPLTIKSSLFQLFLIWCHALIWTLAPFFGWNRYVPEGNMTACGTDYFSKDWNSISYLICYASCVYMTPLLTIIWAYYHIVKAVATHEKQMREQAKKMNVASLRSDGNNTSAEYKLAKVALMTISLWFLAWTPYGIINFSGVFDLLNLSPLTTIWSSVFAKANACYNPIVYAISHPKFRAALNKKFPSLVCGSVEQQGGDSASAASGVTAVTTEDKSSA